MSIIDTLKKLKNYIYNLFHPKKQEHKTFGEWGFEEGCSDDSMGIRCKNCEEYLEQYALGTGGVIKPHGKWKPVSTHWRKYVKTNVLWERKIEIDIKKDAYYKFNEQIKWRKRKYGNPLPTLQKIKAARAISHEVYPAPQQGGTYYGTRGHLIREKFRREILKSVDVDYIIK